MTDPSPHRPHIILCTVGSSGDVHPIVGLGRTLQQRGFRITLVTAGYFRPLAEESGFEFIDTMPDCDFREMLSDPQIWHPWRGTRKVFELAVKPSLAPTYRAIEAIHDPHNTLLVGSTLAFGARVAQEKFKLPLATVHLSPALFRSEFEGPRLPRVYVHLGPRWLKRFQWFIADRMAIDPLITPWLNSFRGSLGLKPISRVFKDWWHSPDKVIAMFPDWFCAKQPDWPSQTCLTGFPLYSEEGITEPSADLVNFLRSGPKPLAFTPGSANLFGNDFFRSAAAACQQLGKRAILLTRFNEQIPAELPEGTRHFDFAPFRWLLPQCEMLIHHGGVGSMSQAMLAGIPQIIMPMAFDQVDNAYRVEKLGIGRAIERERFTAPNLASTIQTLLSNPATDERAKTIAAQISQSAGLATAADEIERLWRSRYST